MNEGAPADSQAWDDSALIDSWNEAFEEYKHYHSLSAKGEDVEEVLQGEDTVQHPGDKKVESLQYHHVSDVNVEEQVNDTKPNSNMTDTSVPAKPNARPKSTISPSSPSTLLPLLVPGGENAALKNLMMSWYYAGYYTGLHEGEQRALQAQTDIHTAETVDYGAKSGVERA